MPLNYGLAIEHCADAHDEYHHEVAVLMRRILGLFVAAALAFPQSQDYTFKSATNLVVVNVVVRDKDGKVIEGLKPEQFTLIENGKAQTISVFEFQKLTGAPAPATRTTEAPAVGAPTSNAAKGPLRYRDRRLLVLFFDFAGMPIADQIRAQDSARNSLTSK